MKKDLIQPVFDYIYRYISSPRKSIQKLATKAFLKICQTNHDFVLGNVEIFIKML